MKPDTNKDEDEDLNRDISKALFKARGDCRER